MSESGSFTEARPPWLLALGALLILVLLIGGFLLFRPSMPSFGSGAMTAERLAQQIENDPVSGDMYRAIKTAYPAEYQAFLTRTANVMRREGEAGARREAFNFGRNLTRSKLDDMLRAPAVRLQSLAGVYADLTRSLREHDVNLCGRFITVGFTPDTRIPRGILTQFNNLVPLQLSLARAGAEEGGPTRREASEAEAAAFVARLAAISPSSAELVQDEARLMAAPPAEQCDAGVDIYRAVATLPPETAANVMAVLVRESFRGP